MSLKDLSVSKVQSLMEEHFRKVGDGDIEGIESWHELKWGASGVVESLGEVHRVADYGGEGKGDEYWVAFSVTNGDVTRYFRMDGWYASYTGAEFDGDLREVTPQQKAITVWE